MLVADPEGFLLTICENGYGKRTPFGPNTLDETNGEEEPTAEEAPEPVEPEATADGTDAESSPDRSSMRYRKQKRGGKGVRDIRTSERNGPVVGIASVRDTDEIMLITLKGMVNRTKVREVRAVGRNTQGVRVMNVESDDRIVSLAKVVSEEIEPTEVPTSEDPAPQAE